MPGKSLTFRVKQQEQKRHRGVLLQAAPKCFGSSPQRKISGLIEVKGEIKSQGKMLSEKFVLVYHPKSFTVANLAQNTHDVTATTHTNTATTQTHTHTHLLEYYYNDI